MKKMLSSVCAFAMAATMSATIPAAAAPLSGPSTLPAEASGSNVIHAQGNFEFRMEHNQLRRHPRHRSGNFRRDGRYAYLHGHRGYSYHRPGYRRHNGFWFPPAAFIAGAIIGGAIASQPRVGSYNSAHVDWCYSRYRSYRASDNTFQPYNGPRRQCRSPYG